MSEDADEWRLLAELMLGLFPRVDAENMTGQQMTQILQQTFTQAGVEPPGSFFRLLREHDRDGFGGNDLKNAILQMAWFALSEGVAAMKEDGESSPGDF